MYAPNIEIIFPGLKIQESSLKEQVLEPFMQPQCALQEYRAK